MRGKKATSADKTTQSRCRGLGGRGVSGLTGPLKDDELPCLSTAAYLMAKQAHGNLLTYMGAYKAFYTICAIETLTYEWEERTLTLRGLHEQCFAVLAHPAGIEGLDSGHVGTVEV